MTQLSASPSLDGLTLGPEDFRRIAQIAHRDYGLNIEISKQALIQSRLRRRLRALDLQSFSDYLRLVESGEKIEIDHFIGALTTNVTRFFREPHHFKKLGSEVLPELAQKAKAGAPVRFWSAGCSSGQEPYSIGATIIRTIPDAPSRDLKILATDLDPFVLAKAETGLYAPEETEIADDTRSEVLFDGRDGDGMNRIRPEIRRLISFGRLNLNDAWPMKRQFDVIFCRNVVIYFDQPTQSTLWQRFCDALHPGGHLFIGHSERVHGPSLEHLKPAGLNCYQKTDL